MSHEAIALHIHLVGASEPEPCDDEAVFGGLSPRRDPGRAARAAKSRPAARSRPGRKPAPRVRG